MPSEFNSAYLLHYVGLEARDGDTILDFGCGRGELVRALRTRGFDAFGADVFYQGNQNLERPDVQEALADGTLRRIDADGHLPFEDASVDLVVADQVIEHVEHLNRSSAELRRVLRPGGKAYLQFPVRETWREPHIGIPFAHWFQPGALRTAYVSALRSAGLGKFKDEQPTRAEWVRAKLEWVDRYTFYRSLRDIEHVFAAHGFEARQREMAYCAFRAASRPTLRRALTMPGSAWIVRYSFVRLGFVCLELQLGGAPADRPNAY